MGICLKFLSEIIQIPNTAELLVDLFNKIIQEKTVPDCFKVSTITPLIKNKKLPATDLNNLRAIFVLPELTKIFERIIYNQLLQYLVSTTFFNPNQFGFRSQHSTEHVLLLVTDMAFRALDKKEVCIVVSLDLKRAFPSVNRKLLLRKLADIGIDTEPLASYLSNRKQRVKLNDQLSDEVCDYYGVPAGSCLGNLLFTIFINDISKLNVNSLLLLFADDSTLVKVCGLSEVDLTLTLIEEHIVKILKCLAINDLALNASKTELMIE